jgi:hypothetical protein
MACGSRLPCSLVGTALGGRGLPHSVQAVGQSQKLRNRARGRPCRATNELELAKACSFSASQLPASNLATTASSRPSSALGAEEHPFACGSTVCSGLGDMFSAICDELELSKSYEFVYRVGDAGRVQSTL